MRVSLLLFASLLVGLAMAQQNPTAEPLQFPRGVSVPVILKKTIDTAKAKRGDVVRVELLHPTVAEGSIVIPENARIYGHILDTHGFGDPRMAMLAVVLDKAEWKHHSVPLQAHVAGFGKMKLTVIEGRSKCNPENGDVYNAPPSAPRGSRDGNTITPSRPPVSPFNDAQCDILGPQVETDLSSVRHVKLLRTTSADAPVAMVSAEKNIVLKKGMLLLVRSGQPLPTIGVVSPQTQKPRP